MAHVSFRVAVVLAVLGVSALGAASAPAGGAGRVRGVKPVGITAVLVATKDSYVLNPAQSGKTFRESLVNLRDRAPTPPAVDLVMRLTNPTEAPITLTIGGDQSVIHLKLDGPKDGAVTVANNVPMTMEFRSGAPVTIAPGKTYDIKITSLSAGARGISECSYWTEPGEYNVAAVLTSNSDDGKETKVTSDPVKVKVTKEAAK